LDCSWTGRCWQGRICPSAIASVCSREEQSVEDVERLFDQWLDQDLLGRVRREFVASRPGRVLYFVCDELQLMDMRSVVTRVPEDLVVSFLFPCLYQTLQTFIVSNALSDVFRRRGPYVDMLCSQWKELLSVGTVPDPFGDHTVSLAEADSFLPWVCADSLGLESSEDGVLGNDVELGNSLVESLDSFDAEALSLFDEFLTFPEAVGSTGTSLDDGVSGIDEDFDANVLKGLDVPYSFV
jgi:hypothetical protein